MLDGELLQPVNALDGFIEVVEEMFSVNMID
jgi:hypothetical protein